MHAELHNVGAGMDKSAAVLQSYLLYSGTLVERCRQGDLAQDILLHTYLH
jgi:hypothetical protein